MHKDRPKSWGIAERVVIMVAKEEWWRRRKFWKVTNCVFPCRLAELICILLPSNLSKPVQKGK